jgi:DNA-binding response OmpR family regulator
MSNRFIASDSTLARVLIDTLRMHRVLLVEANPAIATAVRAVLEHHAFAVDVVSDEAEIRRTELSAYAVVIIDVHREPRRGLDDLEWLFRNHSWLMPRVVVITADDSDAIRDALGESGICEVVVKPVSPPEILRAVLECLEKSPTFSVQ